LTLIITKKIVGVGGGLGLRGCRTGAGDRRPEMKYYSIIKKEKR
jgi:hypothetical protein